MDYEFKDFPEKTWKLYTGWLEVRHLPKFSYSAALPNDESLSSSVNDDATDSAKDFVVSPTSKKSCGTRRGCDAAKLSDGAEKLKQQRMEKRDKQFQEISESLASVSSRIQTKTRIAAIKEASKVVTQKDVKQKLKAKLIEIAMEI